MFGTLLPPCLRSKTNNSVQFLGNLPVMQESRAESNTISLFSHYSLLDWGSGISSQLGPESGTAQQKPALPSPKGKCQLSAVAPRHKTGHELHAQQSTRPGTGPRNSALTKHFMGLSVVP